MKQTMLNTQQTAEFFGTNVETIRMLANLGYLPKTQIGPGKRYYFRSDVLEFINDRIEEFPCQLRFANKGEAKNDH